MTESRLKELQTEIARLEKLDNEITERVNAEFENEVECSAELDLAMHYESE